MFLFYTFLVYFCIQYFVIVLMHLQGIISFRGFHIVLGGMLDHTKK